MRSKVFLCLAIAAFISGCSASLPDTDDPVAMMKHFVALVNRGDVWQAVQYLVDNGCERGAPLTEERKNELREDALKAFERREGVKYEFTGMTPYGHNRARMGLKLMYPDGKREETTTCPMMKIDKRWWFQL
jgi:hypothetical protein